MRVSSLISNLQKERVFSCPQEISTRYTVLPSKESLIYQHYGKRKLNCSLTKISRRYRAVRKGSSPQFVYSRPTMCLHCHLIVEMVHERDADPQKGSWQCPECGHMYPFQHWKIRKQSAKKAEAA